MHTDIGFQFRLSNVSAAMGLGQLSQIEEIFKKKFGSNLINHKTKIIAVTHCSNIVGSVNNLKKIKD